MQRVASFRNRRYNAYVPAMGYAADVIHGAAYEVDFLTPILSVATGILSAVAGTSGVAMTTFGTDTADAPFGRNVIVGAGGNHTVRGKDYLGQGMAETIAASTAGKKAFKWIDSITPAFTGNVTAGFGDVLGLPYRMSNVLEETVDGAESAVGTFVAGILTDPQTLTTGDPRGTYDPTAVLDGSKRIMAKFQPYNVLNTNGNGGLHGIQHVAS
jgi:hypothetical protein